MNISNDRGSKPKIALLSFALFLVSNGVTWVFFGAKAPTFSMVISGLAAIGAFLFFRSKIRCLVRNVKLTNKSILYTINQKQFEVRKTQISKIGDSGINSAPHEIIIFLHDGKTVEFFPSKEYGNFYQGKLKKILQSWLVSAPMEPGDETVSKGKGEELVDKI